MIDMPAESIQSHSCGARCTGIARAPLLMLIWTAYHVPFFLGTPVYDPPDTHSYEHIADVLLGTRPFPDEAFHFPPGYSFVLALLRPLCGSQAPWAVTVLQHVAIAVMGLMLLDLGNRLRRPRVGFLAGLLVILNPALLFWTHVMYTEIFTSLALVGIIWCVQRGTDTPGSRMAWVAAAGAFVAWAGLARQVPYVLAIPVGVYCQNLFRGQGTARRVSALLLPIAMALVAFLAWSAFMWQHFGRFEHTSGGGRHLYNRVVHTDKTIARDRPATRRLLETISTTEILEPHWTVYELLKERGYSSAEANDLMTQVSIEAVVDRPLKYAYGTGQLFLRYWFLEPDRLDGSIRSPALLPLAGELIKPVVTLLVYCTSHRVLGALALLGAAYAFFGGTSILRLTVAVTVFYLLPHAAGEWASSRFGIPIYPLVAYLGSWGVLVAGAWLQGGVAMSPSSGAIRRSPPVRESA